MVLFFLIISDGAELAYMALPSKGVHLCGILYGMVVKE